MDRVFGAGRLQMATGAHVEVFREAVEHGVERRYTKRFLAGPSGDFRAWTEREWRVLQRLAWHRAPVAKPLELLTADASGAVALQTRDAGATLEQWATLVPLRRGERALRSVFEDCAHWWSLARHCLLALDAVHALGFVHLELKPDNVCIPWAPAGAGRPLPGQPLRPRFKGLALIDVAFSLVPGVDYAMPLPLLRQPAYEYQSPRLLHALEEGRRGHLAPTRALDWRCDFFSLAGMLWHYLPELDDLPASGWSTAHHLAASEFVQHLLDLHGAAMPADWPHYDLIAVATERLREPELAAALDAGTSFDPGRSQPLAAAATPPTRLAQPSPPPPTPTPAPSATEPIGEATSVGPTPATSPPAPLFGSESGQGDAFGASPGRPPASASAPATRADSPSPAPAPEPTAGRLEATAGEPAKAEPTPTEPASQETIAAARRPLQADRAAARRRLAKRVASGIAVVAAVAFGWWFGGEQEPRLDMPSLSDLAEHPSPASSLPRTQLRPQPPAALSDRAPAASAAMPTPTPVPVPTPPPVPTPAPPQAAAPPSVNDELVARAEAWQRDRLPAVAVAAERHLARVLATAAGSAEFRRRSNVRAAARAMRTATPPPPVAADGEQARSLNDAALVSYGKGSNLAEAITLQIQAFGANPFDSEVAGNLAFLYLKESPPQAEVARRLALHALTLNDVRFPRGRIEDWATLAVANALTGHDVDARNAWFVALALTGDLQHLCDAAVRAEASHGERVRPSVQALLQRARSSAAYGRCEVAAAPKESRAKAQAKPAPRPRRTIP